MAQFAPPAGMLGTTAIFKDSSVFLDWASSGNVIRGFQDISLPANGYANVGDSSSAFGLAGENGVVSLGDAGYAILGFNSPIIDELGNDFAVFENSFDDTFLELAFVEVSSDGIHFFRFPAISNTDTVIQTWSFGLTDATKINNLAGKYRGGYGTPFDLSDIPDNILLDKQSITHVKVIDVVGSIQNQYASRDVNGHKINDPWPTSFGSSGFDLDAIGVIHRQSVGINELELSQISVFPNPVTNVLNITVSIKTNYSICITNLLGEIVLKTENSEGKSSIPLSDLKQGVYFITFTMQGTKPKQLKIFKI